MTERRLECPRCRGRMEPGYVMDRGDQNSRHAAQWVEGPPERSFWTGLKLKDRAVLPVTTYRCAECGYLESYATVESA
jgi:hypothetical protein